MLNKTGTRLSAALLAYFLLIIFLLTLNPFYLAWPRDFTFTFRSGINNLVANIFLFLPLGFFYRLTTRRRGALLLGACISLIIEMIQLFVPARTPSVIDILANTLGAGLGAMIYDILSARIAVSKGMVGRLRLETPLMGLIYLLLPLLWIDTLALTYFRHRWILTSLIGLCGAIIFSELFQHWQETINFRTQAYASFAVGIWFFLGTGPALRFPLRMLIIGAGLVLLTAVLTTLPQKSTERRFEHTTLQRIFPIFTLYLVLLALWEPWRSLATWHITLGFTNLATETSMQALMPRVEYLIAFTVLGYLLAEWRGRSELPLAQDLPRLFVSSLGIALTLEFFVGLQSGPGASLIRVVMVVVSALFGGMIYHLLRAHIRFLLGRG